MRSLEAHLADEERHEVAHEVFQASDEWQHAFNEWAEDEPDPTEHAFESSADYGDAFERWYEAMMEPPA